MDTKLLFIDSGAAAVQLSTELREKDYFRQQLRQLSHISCDPPCLIAGKELGG